MTDTIFHRRYRDAVEQNSMQHFEAFCKALDIWLEVKAIPSDVGLWVYLRDITAKKRRQEELDKCLETQNQLLNQVMRAQEVERRRISMEIHDGPLQLLAVSLMSAERAIKRTEQGETDAAKIELQSITETLHDTIHEMRYVLADLSPEVLNTYGLAMAIQSHSERFAEATGMEVAVRNRIADRLPPETELLLYRLAQEALANARKHSRANRVTIELERAGDEMTLAIRDDGMGFYVEDALNKHKDGDCLGLRSMKQRIEAVGGSMHITSAPGEGTAINFHYPIGE
jgi:two-component system sensor histidine kinase DegS